MVAVDGSNDDQGWWSLAWIRACVLVKCIECCCFVLLDSADSDGASLCLRHDRCPDVCLRCRSMATGEHGYVTRSEGYFQHVSQYWDSTCNGGVWWSSKKGYKVLFLRSGACVPS